MASRWLVLGTAAWLGGIPAHRAAASDAGYRIVADVKSPVASVLTADGRGNLYGELTPPYEPAGVFELTARTGYSTEDLLYTFGNGGTIEGSQPSGGMTLAGRFIIGTTAAGGIYNDGTAFNLGRPSTTSFTALHAFNHAQHKPSDGAEPLSGLSPGPRNLYYGTTAAGGGGIDAGTVFSVSASTTNPRYAVLHRFGALGDGVRPTAGRLAVDAQGRLFGVTYGGGALGYGSVYVMQDSGAGWQEQVIYSFPGGNVLFGPPGNVVLDSSDNVYGCAQGGTHGHGAIYRLTPPTGTGGGWQMVVVYNFGDGPNDPLVVPSIPDCSLAYDPVANRIVGTTSHGGGSFDTGTLFQLTSHGGADPTWNEKVVHRFSTPASAENDGAHPTAPPLLQAGTYYGGNTETGAIYAYTP